MSDARLWLSRDPIDEQGGLNLYLHTGNNTVNGIDCFGLVAYSWQQQAGPSVVTMSIDVDTDDTPSGTVLTVKYDVGIDFGFGWGRAFTVWPTKNDKIKMELGAMVGIDGWHANGT